MTIDSRFEVATETKNGVWDVYGHYQHKDNALRMADWLIKSNEFKRVSVYDRMAHNGKRKEVVFELRDIT